MTHSVFDQVRAFVVRLAPDPVCDDCIADRLGLSADAHVNLKTGELGGMAEFENQIRPCTLCTIEKSVIRAKG